MAGPDPWAFSPSNATSQFEMAIRCTHCAVPVNLWSGRALLPQSQDPHLARHPRRPHVILSGADRKSP
jgi:hypothetical protein